MMIYSGGHKPDEVARKLMRALAAVRPKHGPPPPRRITLTQAVDAHERARIRTKARGTAQLQTDLVEALDRTRAKFWSALGITPKEALREADGESPDEQNYLDAVDQMTPDEVAAALAEAMQVMYQQGVIHAAAEIHGGEFALDSTRANTAIENYALRYSTKVLDQDREQLKALIRTAFEGGSSATQLKNDIVNYFDDGLHQFVQYGEGQTARLVPIDTWASTVARTEIAQAQNAGIFDLYAEAGIAQVQWLSAEDERVEPLCEELDGQVAARGENFPGTDVSQPPLHPNCRCTLVAAPGSYDVPTDSVDTGDVLVESFFGHVGRPGLRGGALPRDAGGALRYKGGPDALRTASAALSVKAQPAVDALKAKLAALFPNANITGRAKSPTSIYDKVDQKGGTEQDLRDAAAARAEFPDVASVRAAAMQMRAEYGTEITRETNSLDNPADGFYRAWHFNVVQDGVNSEVQLRTANQGQIAEWAHETIYKPHAPNADAIRANLPTIQHYARSMGDYYWNVDNGRSAGPQPDCAEVVSQTVGCL